ncbi:MAG: SDR family oxidoreductase [Kiloniellales bacterium]
MKVRGSVAVVTGANRGIGKAFVEALAAAGADRLYAGARDPESLSELKSRLDGIVVSIALDVTKPDQVQAAAKLASDATLLINNAGVAQFVGLVGASGLEAARQEMETNYFGVLAMIRAFAPILKANGGGAIATVSSIAGHVNFPALGSYSASKAAVHSLIQGVRGELRAQRTLVVGVYPGPVETDMARDIEAEKVPPAQIATATLEAIEQGLEDVFPDPVSQQLHAGLLSDPKTVERQAAEFGAAQ